MPPASTKPAATMTPLSSIKHLPKRSCTLAKPNFDFQKRQKEIAKKKKHEEKKKRKLEKSKAESAENSEQPPQGGENEFRDS
jgi:phage protein D